jgi:bifunctional DNA-binding transcriptional regulator/antitoxin component of YhaV-PrlF toxin-antitoxin module
MTQTISITNKWQVHIPVDIRKDLGINRPGLAQISTDKGVITIKPIENDVFKFAGRYNNEYRKSKVNIDKIREHIDYEDL